MKKVNIISLHGFKGTPDSDYHRYLQREMKQRGYQVSVPLLPNTENPKQDEQIAAVLRQCNIDENTIIVAHSLGCAVAMKLLMQLQQPIKTLILVAPVMEPAFSPPEKMGLAYWQGFDFDYDYECIQKLANQRVVVSDLNEAELRGEYCRYLAEKISARLDEITAQRRHITGYQEPYVLQLVQEFVAA